MIQALTDAPAAIRAEGMAIVRETTESAAAEMAHTYPVRTGTLRSRVRTSYPSSTVLLGIAHSEAPHAGLYEFGTKVRKTATGANRGAMPAASPRVVAPIAQRHRAQMLARLLAMMRGFGFVIETES